MKIKRNSNKIRLRTITLLIVHCSLLIVTACDLWMKPMSDFIRDATGDARGTELTILTKHYPDNVKNVRTDSYPNAVTNIPPGERTEIQIDIRNPQGYDLELVLIDNNTDTEIADSLTPSGTGIDIILENMNTAKIIIYSPNRNDEFDLTMTMTANGRPMPECPLPKMKAIYLDDTLASLAITSPAGVTLSPSFDPDETSYTANLEYNATSVTIAASVPAGKYSRFSIDGNDIPGNSGSRTITPLSSTNEIKITVTAECGRTKTYTVTAIVGETYTISFNGNTNTGGDAPSEMKSGLNYKITLPDENTLVKTGYTFAGWNTQANGMGSPYSAGAEYTVTGNATLHAMWTINSYTVTVTRNPIAGGTAYVGATGTSTTALCEYNSEVTIRATPAEGYAFKEWTETIGGFPFQIAFTSTATITVTTSNRTVRANFVAIGEDPDHPIVYTVSDSETLDSINTKIEEGGDNKYYRVIIEDDATITSAGTGTNVFGSAKVTVTYTGGGTISRGTGTGYLILLAANQTLILEDITIQGDSSTRPVMGCTGAGHIIMGNGSLITGNNVTSNSDSQASVVRVDNGGRFTMNGGVISGNYVVNVGGAVLVSSGTFEMNGGTITNNEAGNGGGVYVLNNDGTFTNNYPAGIYGNTPSNIVDLRP